jgi:hypothetical protein
LELTERSAASQPSTEPVEPSSGGPTRPSAARCRTSTALPESTDLALLGHEQTVRVVIPIPYNDSPGGVKDDTCPSDVTGRGLASGKPSDLPAAGFTVSACRDPWTSSGPWRRTSKAFLLGLSHEQILRGKSVSADAQSGALSRPDVLDSGSGSQRRVLRAEKRGNSIPGRMYVTGPRLICLGPVHFCW